MVGCLVGGFADRSTHRYYGFPLIVRPAEPHPHLRLNREADRHAERQIDRQIDGKEGRKQGRKEGRKEVRKSD